MKLSDLPAREREKIKLYTEKERRGRRCIDSFLDEAKASEEARLSADHSYHQRWARWHRIRAQRHKQAEHLARDEFKSMFATVAIADIHLMMAKWHERRADYHDSIWN